MGIAIPQTFINGQVDMAHVRACLVRAEELGFDSAWVAEKLFGPLTTLEAASLLAYAAAATATIRLGCAVLQTAVRGPVLMAKMLSTIDQLCQGRLTVGVGLGAHPDFFAAVGLDSARRGRRYDEGLRLMHALWTEDVVTFEGEFYTVVERRMEPKPVQRPHPPLLFGASSPAGVARAVRLGDGLIGAGSSSTAAFAQLVTSIGNQLEQAGRDPASFPLGKRVYLAVDDDRNRARSRLRDWFGAWYGRPELADEAGVFGPVDECAEELQQIIDLGATLLQANPVFDELEQMEVVAHEVVPRLRAATAANDADQVPPGRER